MREILTVITGAAGFEPANGGVKVHSLTAWRRPREFELEILIQIKFNIGQEGIRTPDTVVRSHVL